MGKKTGAFQCDSNNLDCSFFKVMDKVKLLHCKAATRVQLF